MSPTGTDQRRFSRSPRSQRSRSTDVDRLHKYADQIEQRRNTGGTEANRLYAAEWLNLPTSPHSYGKNDSDKTLEITESNEKLKLRKISQSSRDSTGNSSRNYSHWNSMQSDDDVVPSNNFQIYPDGRLMSFRWIPLPRLGDRPEYTQKTFSMELHSASYAANKWITFAKHLSPASSRSILDRKSSMIKFSSYYDREMKRNCQKCETILTTDNDSETTSAESFQTKTKVALKEEMIKKSALLSQEIQELYKIEFQGTKKSSVSSSTSYWMSRSSSDDEDDENNEENTCKRRYSQDLEFNDRNEKNRPKFFHLLKRFNKWMKYHEDMGSERETAAKYEKKAFLEDYGNIEHLVERNWREKLNVNDESESTDTSIILDDSGKQSDKSRIVKCGSVECKSSSKKTQLSARRAHSYGADHRSTTPVTDDINSDSQSAKSMMLRQKRKSTRYKVYLT